VDKKLKDMAAKLRQFAGPGAEEKKEAKKESEKKAKKKTRL
jgi:hypothetical protein